MNPIRRWMSAVAFVSALFAAPQAGAITNLVVFGDSLSDPGSAAALTSGFFPPFPPYAAGHFSNGPTAAEYLAQSYGIPVVKGWPNAAGANNMAVGGALTGIDDPVLKFGNYNYIIDSPLGLQAYTAVAPTSVAQQITKFLSSNPTGLMGADTLTMLWAGPNDFFLGFALGRDPGVVLQTAVANMANNIGALALAGAKNILVPNMPDLGSTPSLSSTDFATPASVLSSLYNFYLAQVVAEAALNLGPLGVRLYTADTAALLNDAIANPTEYGFTNVKDACIDSPEAFLNNCSGYLFFDGVHPTTAAHRYLAAEFAAAVPEPSTYALLALGMLCLAAFSRRRRA
jgi:phospholipase/lecithinase/hemolysin